MLSDTDTCVAFQVPSARKTILCVPAVPQAHTPARAGGRPATSAKCVQVSLSVLKQNLSAAQAGLDLVIFSLPRLEVGFPLRRLHL